MTQPQAPHIVAGEPAILARRYATALFELAEEQDAIAPVAADLEALQDAILHDPKFHAMAAHPRIPVEQVQKVIRAIAEAVKFHALTTSFLLRVAQHHRLEILDHMIAAFKDDLAAKKGLHVAVVTSAHPLSAAQQEALAAGLGKVVGGTVRLILRQAPDLLGGLVVKLGSRLIDASIKGKLTRIERHLKAQREAA